MLVGGALSAVLSLCCFASCLLSFLLVLSHARNWSQPLIQRKIVSILWMVPIYAVEALVSLRLPHQAPLLDMARDCYEAYVVYVFFSLCAAYIGTGDSDSPGGAMDVSKVLITLQEQGCLHHPPPFDRFLAPWSLSSQPQRFLTKCKVSILQFVLVKPLCTFLALCLAAGGSYHEGSIDFGSGYIYVAVIDNVSISLSLYYLVLFYLATRTALAPHYPWAKFLCIKCVVFFTWWQGLLLSVLCWVGILTRFDGSLGEEAAECGELATYIQNVLIQFEMLLLAIVHIRVFSAVPFKLGQNRLSAQQPLASLMPIDREALREDLREMALPPALGGGPPVDAARIYVPPERDHSPLPEDVKVCGVVSRIELPNSQAASASSAAAAATGSVATAVVPVAPAVSGSGVVFFNIGDDDEDAEVHEEAELAIHEPGLAIHEHPLEESSRAIAWSCDVCKGSGTGVKRFRCSVGCNFDVCEPCYRRGQELEMTLAAH